MRFNTILFTTDFSDCAERAFSHASHLSARYDAHLHVLNVVPPGHSPDEGPLAYMDLTKEEDVWTDAYQADAEDGVAVVHSSIKAASAVEGILEYAKSYDVDLIVMGTHGRTGIDHLLSGSVAEDVVRHASCPVLTVRCSERAGWKEQVNRILVPVDFSEHMAVGPALELARIYGAEVDLLHVIEEAVLPTIYGVEPLSPGAPLYVQRTEGALRKAVEDFDTEDLEIRAHVRIGNPSRRILEFAEEDRCDLIVVASQGRTGLGRLLMGSVAEKVIRLSEVPVFTVKRGSGLGDAANGHRPDADEK
ncbi:MAG: universal stress protein [Rhodothermales bacterium]